MEIDQRLPYRIGSPNLPVLPVETGSCSKMQFDPHFLQYVEDVLRGENIQIVFSGLMYRFHKGDANPCPTVFLISSFEAGCEERWVDAVRAIRERLNTINLSHCAVELIDRSLYQGPPRPLPIETNDHAIINVWDDVLPKIRQMIGNYEWITIDLLRWYSPVSRRFDPTVVISARDVHLESWWQETLPVIRRLIKDRLGLDTYLDVHLLFLDKLSLCGTLDSSKHQLPEPVILLKTYVGGIYFGSSCGRVGSKWSGTLGGKIVLNKEGVDHEFGLTNAHVLLHDTGILAEHAGPYSPRKIEAYNVSSPSDRDHETAIDNSNEEISRQEEALELLQTSQGDASPNEREKKRLTIAEEAVKQAERHLSFISNTVSRDIGTVYASSGYTTCNADSGYTKDEWEAQAAKHKPPFDTDWALDWCLVSLNEDADLSNVLSDHPLGAQYLKNKMEINNWLPVCPNTRYRVAKRGRSSGWTSGDVSATTSAVNLHGDFVPKVADGHTMMRDTIKDQFQTKPVAMHCIVSDTAATGNNLLLPGDSGSFILLDEEIKGTTGSIGATVIGLGYASNDSSRGSYMIPMQMIVNSIEEVTGGEVVHPRKLQL